MEYIRQTFALANQRNNAVTVTLAEIAKAAGVSISTVSRALTNTKHPLKEETRQRIISLAEQMGYNPNLVARSLQSDRTHVVGVIVDRMQSPFVAATIQGIQDGLRQAGYSISIINSNRDQDLVVEAIQTFHSRRADGIVILNSWLHTCIPSMIPSYPCKIGPLFLSIVYLVLPSVIVWDPATAAALNWPLSIWSVWGISALPISMGWKSGLKRRIAWPAIAMC